MLKIEKELHRIFSARQIGFITRCLEQIPLPSSVEWIKNEFREDEDIEALPIEDNGAIVGILEKGTFFSLSKKFHGEVRLKDLKNILIEKLPEINAEDLIDNVFEKIVSEKMHEISSYFLVYYRGSYMGFVSLLQIIRQMNQLIVMDMDKAREVQANLLEKARYTHPLIEFGVYNQMAGRVGGDFYINYLYKNRNFQIIGCFDVSGKGFSASMGTITIGSFMTSLNVHEIEDIDPNSFSQKLDNYVKELSPEGSFIAGGLVFIDYESEKCYIQNFGLPHIVVFDVDESDNKKIIKIIQSNLPPFGWGSLIDIKAVFEEFVIKKDLRVIIFTDGLSELKDQYGVQFGEDSIRELIIKNTNLRQDEFIKLISDTVDKYRKNTLLSDDITLVDIRFN